MGRTPRSAAHPLVFSAQRALGFGWDGGPGYADAVAPYCRWLVETARSGDWRAHFPQFAQYSFDPFDYAAEDAR